MPAINPNSLYTHIIRSIVKAHSGLGVKSIQHHLDLSGVRYKDSVLNATLTKMVKKGLLLKDNFACGSCRRPVMHYSVSDAARHSYQEALQSRPIPAPAEFAS